MSTTSKIEWTDKTWNPVVGCTRVSAGCDHCYAVRMSHRLRRMPGYEDLTDVNERGDRHFNGTVRCLPERLMDPLRWRKPCRIFVNSMSDLFHEKVPFDFIDQVFAAMALCDQHTFQILTKRPERMAAYTARIAGSSPMAEHLGELAERLRPDDGASKGIWQEFFYRTYAPNIWLGTSVEDQKTADERVPHLLRCPAAVRFLSCEPLLGPINLSQSRPVAKFVIGERLPWLDWVIAGGESGPGARPMDPHWVRSIRDQCHAAGVPFFFKQWGEYIPVEDFNSERGWDYVRVGKGRAGAELDGREWRQYPT